MPGLNRTKIAMACSLVVIPAGVAVSAWPAHLQSLSSMEARARQFGITPSEVKLQGALAKIEGRDAQGRKVELTLHRRTGELLNRDYDDD